MRELDKYIVVLLSMAKNIEEELNTHLDTKGISGILERENYLSESTKLVPFHYAAEWMRLVASCLYLESKYKQALDNAERGQIMANLELSEVDVWGKEKAVEWYNKTSDHDHPLRYMVETITSVEDVRIYLKTLRAKNIGFNNLLRLKNKHKWEVRS